jgi:two-component system chemotaxis sensor kinase CheA
MDDLLREFLTETSESLDVVDVELVKFEQDPKNKDVLDRIFRLVHTIKGTCGFLGLPRLEAVAHASETLLGKFRDDSVVVTPALVTMVLESLDRIKEILARLEADEEEPEGDDTELIERLDEASAGNTPNETPAEIEVQVEEAAKADTAEAPIDPTIGRELKPGEVSLDELDAIFNSTPGPENSVESPAGASDVPAPNGDQTTPHAAAKAVEPDTKSPAERDSKEEGAPRSNEPSIANQSIRVSVDVLENLMTMVSELVLTRNQLLEMVRRMEDSEFKVPLQRLSNVTAELQEGVLKTRMQPIGNAWQKLPRIVRDLTQELGKKIDLEMIGKETELDRQVLELIKDPLTHMVRNSADHGLEQPEDRVAAGKPATGKITLNAYHEGGQIIIEVGDDGRGLSVEKIRNKVIENGLATDAELDALSEQQILKFLFKAGFSTATVVTNVSGRGVGMDVVRSNIELIGGTVDLRTVEGEGTTFTIKIPLTLAIVSALIVESAGEKYAIPQLSVIELVRTKNKSDYQIENINDTPVLRLRNKLLPLVYLSDLLELRESALPADTALPTDESLETENNIEEPSNDAEVDCGEAFVVVTQVGDQTFGIIVDEVFDTEEIVVKPVSSILREISMFSGNTILGDGSVIMIIDPNGVASTINNENHEKDVEVGEGAQQLKSRDNSTSLLVFQAGDEKPKAVPLALITRLEEVAHDSIEAANGQSVIQYRGALMPLIKVNPSFQLKAEGRQPILVFTERDRSMGLVVDKIVDIVEDELNIEIAADQLGMLGSAIIEGQATEVLDVGYFLTQAFSDWFENRDRTSSVSGKKVLFVDDSAFFRNMITPLLTVAGYAVTSVDNAADALKLKDDGAEFDVIVSDIEMPGMSGIEFAEEIRREGSWTDVPLVAVSSKSSKQDVERGRAAGFVQYVAKFDRDALVETLDQTLSTAGKAA